MNFLKDDVARIRNRHRRRLDTDFYMNHLSFMVLVVSSMAALALSDLRGLAGATLAATLPAGATLAGASLAGPALVGAALVGLFPLFGIAAALLPFWGTVMVGILCYWTGALSLLGSQALVPGIVGSLGLILSTSVHIVYQWDKAVVLRWGRFSRVCQPGLFLILPFAERVADYVDTRIRVTDFSSEKVISADTVPVEVDALCFWMVWDPRKAVLEVEHFMEAVTYAAQTALRDAIGRHSLGEILSRGEELRNEIKSHLEQKMNDWGITVFSIEFTDITIPKDLEDSLSKRAQAEKEGQARQILAQAEADIAHTFATASHTYEAHPGALQLRGMNMVYEGLKNPAGTLMVLPTNLMETMDTGTILGLRALREQKKAGGAS